MAKFLVLGAGLVTAPLVEYLCRRPENTIVVANNILADAQGLVSQYTNASAEQINVTDAQNLQARAAGFDVVISMVPPAFHTRIARACIAAKTHMVTASYQSPEMLALADQAKAANITILNEIGLDPGIDHLSALKIIDEAHGRGEKVEAFVSWCGGIPAPDSNNNPLGYKFSWEPKGAILVLLNQADFLRAGENVTIAPDALMNWVKPVRINGQDFECYPNRNSRLYRDIYNIPEVQTLVRGTLRYPGFCRVMQLAKTLGLFSLEEFSAPHKSTWKQYVGALNKGIDLNTLQAQAPETAWAALDWLGVFSDEVISDIQTPLDTFCALLLDKLSYLDGESDLVVLQHKFIIKKPDGSKYFMTSTLTRKGDPNGYSAMAATVGTPVAIAAQMIADGQIHQTGLILPVSQSVYDPILNLLETENIVLTEQVCQYDIMSEQDFIPELVFV